MRGARLLLAAGAALAVSGCMHQQNAQQVDARAATSSRPAEHLYSGSPASAQQAYDQPIYKTARAQYGSDDDRGLFNSGSREREPKQTGKLSGAGGPYVAASYGYASAPPSVTDRPYTLDAGDKLRVVVFGQDGITNSYVVDAGGKVNLPLVGALSARGLTNRQLAAAIVAKLKQGFVREPHVSVEVETYRPFFILGEVTTPGQYPYVANLTAETAIAKTVELSRRSGGQQVHTEVPLDYPVRPGDTILVKERWF